MARRQRELARKGELARKRELAASKLDAPQCPHARVEPWRKGTHEGGPPCTRTIDRRYLFRSWTMCLDCGTRLERAGPSSLLVATVTDLAGPTGSK